MRHKPPDPRPAWRAIVAAGGLMPVSDTERARHTRVQSVFRSVYGLPDTATDDQLIDAREGDKRGIGELAALYLIDYAARLDPGAELDDIDRAALTWRGDNSPQDDADMFAALSALGQAPQPPATEPQLSLFSGAFADLLDNLP